MGRGVGMRTQGQDMVSDLLWMQGVRLAIVSIPTEANTRSIVSISFITFQDLLRKMEEECKGLVQNFQENCATKIANGEQAIFGSAELEKGNSHP